MGRRQITKKSSWLTERKSVISTCWNCHLIYCLCLNDKDSVAIQTFYWIFYWFHSSCTFNATVSKQANLQCRDLKGTALKYLRILKEWKVPWATKQIFHNSFFSLSRSTTLSQQALPSHQKRRLMPFICLLLFFLFNDFDESEVVNFPFQSSMTK